MTEIKPWQDRVKPGAFTGVKMEAMLAEIAELRARVAELESGEPVRPMSDEDIDDLHDVAVRAFRRHQMSVRGQQITPQDGFEWHFARAIEAHIKGATE